MLQCLLLVELIASLQFLNFLNDITWEENLQLDSGHCILGEFEADYVKGKGKQICVTCTKYIQLLSERPQLD